LRKLPKKMKNQKEKMKNFTLPVLAKLREKTAEEIR